MNSQIPMPMAAKMTGMPTPNPAPRTTLLGPESDDDCPGTGNPLEPTQSVDVALAVTAVIEVSTTPSMRLEYNMGKLAVPETRR